MKHKHTVLLLLLSALVSTASLSPLTAHAAVQKLTFPVIGKVSYSNDFNSPRYNGAHHATDIIANKNQKIISASNGTIQYVTWWEGAGYSVRILGSDGYTYNYYHINNDNPGTDDGVGGKMKAFAPDMRPGNPVVKGQLIGYVGDSGNAETTVPHLHFEIYHGSTAVNPYSHLNAATRRTSPVQHPALPGEVLPIRSDTKIYVNLDAGDLDSNAADTEFAIGAGQGGGPKLKTFKQDGTKLLDFSAYDDGFRGGVNVAVGDVDGDGADDILTAAGVGGGPHVKVFAKDGTLLQQFFAYQASMKKGVNIAVGNVDGDPQSEIIVAPLSGAYPVRVLSNTGVLENEFYPYGTSFTGGIDVSVGDVDANGVDDIVTGAGKTSNSGVLVLDAAGTVKQSFNAYSSSYGGGVRVDVADVAPAPGEEIVTSPYTNGGPNSYVYSANGTQIEKNVFLEDWWRGDYDIAAHNGHIFASSGVNRRPTVRIIQ
ncbi:MAG TPA: M23 family metallopeptidase [Candidatus Saccharibacteria bacterium]|nr:M23 family metallopeptidase [Candidatus Saccharibacteria bacterium]